MDALRQLTALIQEDSVFVSTEAYPLRLLFGKEVGRL